MNRETRITPEIISNFSVEGMRCAACIARIERGLTAQPDIHSARVNLGARRVAVHHASTLTEEAILTAFADIGFDAHAFAGEAVADRSTAETRRLLLAMAVAGFAMMNIMLLSVSVWAGADGMTRGLFHWLSALIAIPTVAYSGRIFFKSAWAALRRRRTNMDVPISIGILLATGMSLYDTAIGNVHAYFDGVVMLIFFLLTGRYLDSLMRQRAEGSVAALLRRVPDEALRFEDGDWRLVSSQTLRAGERIRVATGERVAADGIIRSGESEFDRALVTGESLPERAASGDAVLAGTINLSAPVEVEVTATPADSAIAEIARLMEEAGQGKSRYVRIADRAAALYAPMVHSLAALALIGWLLAGAGLHQALTIAIAVLIITCPCALGLAVPISQVVAAGALMKRGILVRDGSALERLAGVDRAMIDKTGSATMGQLWPDQLPDDPAKRGILKALASSSKHPLSRGLSCALEEQVAAEMGDLREVAGKGVEGDFEGQRWRLGRPDWLGVEATGERPAAAFGHFDGDAMLFSFDDRLRPHAVTSIAQLKALGIAPTLVSGDREEVVRRVAEELGIDHASGVSPADKQARIASWQGEGAKLLMVGDGLNDAPALKAADASIAPAAASDVGRMAADMLFFGDGLDAVPRAVLASRRTMTIIRQNFSLAIGYNVLAVPLALAGRVTPLIAALAMSGSSLIVVANALRLKRAAR